MAETKQKTAAEMLKSAYGQPSGERPEMPAELASAFNFMAHPLAGMAAMSAMGFGFASHAFGLWAGALEGAAAASRRLAPKALEGLAPAHEDERAKTVPLVRARLAVVTSLADARDAARKTALPEAETATKPALAVPVVMEMPAPVRAAAPAVEIAPVTAKLEVPAAVKTKQPTVAKVKPSAPKARIATKTKPAVDVSAAKMVSMAQPAGIARPAVVDDLKAISGVGPKLEQVLNGLGIWTYAQIAGWTPAEVTWVDDRMGFSGRIDRDDWIGQAVTLSGSKQKA